MMHRPRIIPVLLLEQKKLIKTIGFKNPKYLGDPINAIKIFNEKGVDELCVLDKGLWRNKAEIDFEFLKDICSESFMPLSYGGSINSISDIRKLFSLGFEKVIINSAFVKNPGLIKEASTIAGCQSVVVSIDIKKSITGKYFCYINNGKKKIKVDPLEHALFAEKMGAGEILLTSIDNEGKMLGYNLEIIKLISNKLSIPVIAHGGAGSLLDLKRAIDECGASAVAASSIFVYFGLNKAVLINYPEEIELIDVGVYRYE